MKDDFGEPFKGPIIPSAAMVEYHSTSLQDQARILQFGIFLDYELIAVGTWKGGILIANLEDLER